MFIDWVLATIGKILGYSSVAIVLFAIAFVVSKSFNVKWPYKVAILLSVILYALIIQGNMYVNSNGY